MYFLEIYNLEFFSKIVTAQIAQIGSFIRAIWLIGYFRIKAVFLEHREHIQNSDSRARNGTTEVRKRYKANLFILYLNLSKHGQKTPFPLAKGHTPSPSTTKLSNAGRMCRSVQ